VIETAGYGGEIMAGHNITQNRMTAGRAIISALVLWLAFSGVAAAEQLYVNESGWWQEGGAFSASGTPIQAAVGAAGEGDAIYVGGGMYSENVDVDKRLTLEGEGADVVTVTAKLSSDHVFHVTANYVNISGFTVTGATGSYKYGIYLYNADHCNISWSNAVGNYNGIYLSSSSDNILTNNDASNNQFGIYFWSSSDNTLTNNIANSNIYGIWLLYSSSSNMLENNTVNSNNCGICLDCSSNNNMLENNTVNSNNCGIHIDYSSDNILTKNLMNYNTGQNGIHLHHSDNNVLEKNTVNSNNLWGIHLDDSSNNILTKNTANYNGISGIALYSSSNTTLSNNTANSNNNYGIYLCDSSDDTLTNNIVNSNGYFGIYLDNADNNSITCNRVQNNTERGFHISSGSTDNNISYNNIIENGNYNQTSGGWEWQFRNYQINIIGAKHNYWGAGMNSSTIDASIYDDEEGGLGEVEFYPFETEPVPCAPTPEEPPAFTTTDAVIALQIAVGSRLPDPRWDVSGDDRVTSLDALMILQAACGKVDLS
jgi:parallel beta-helix repeat protein